MGKMCWTEHPSPHSIQLGDGCVELNQPLEEFVGEQK